VPFRFFLLSLYLISAAAAAQEAAPEAAAPASKPAATAPAAATPATVPLDPAALLSVGVPRSKEERDDMEQRAKLLQEESRLRKEQAEKALADSKPACWQKFLVSSCLDDARVAYRKEISIAKRQDRESQTLSRNVKKYDAAEHIRLRDEENARKDAANAQKAEKNRAKAAKKQESTAQ